MPGSIHAHVADGERLTVEVVSDQGALLTLMGDLTGLQPKVTEGDVLAENPALLSNAWAYGKAWYEARTSSAADEAALSASDPEAQKEALKEAAAHRKVARQRAESFAKVAQWIADVADDVSPYQPKKAWCSSCFAQTEHRKSNRPSGQMPVYVCQSCGGADASVRRAQLSEHGGA